MRKAIGAMTLGVMVALLAAVPAQASSSDEGEFLRLLNDRRASRGLRALAMKGDLVTIARRHSERMESRGDIYHNPRLSREVSGEKEVGENVGVGPDVPGLDQAFWESSGHRSNIVYTKYNEVGIGVVRTRFDVWVTVVFAHRPAEAPAPKVNKKPSVSPTKKPAVTSTKKPVVKQPAKTQAAPTAPRSTRSDASRGASAPLRSPERSVDLLVRTVALDAA